MRNFEQRKAEVFRRSEERIHTRRKRRNCILAFCIPLCLILTVWSAGLFPLNPGPTTNGGANAPGDIVGSAGSNAATNGGQTNSNTPGNNAGDNDGLTGNATGNGSPNDFIGPDCTVVKTATDLFMRFPEKTDIVGNTEVLKAALENSKLDLESYEIHGLKYTRYYDEQGIEFTGKEGIKVIYHNPLDCDNTCIEVTNNSSSIPDGPISVEIMYAPNGYSPTTFKLDGNNIEDETQGLYLKRTGAFSYYYFFPTPEYCYRFTVANWCENFDAIVNQLTDYCVEVMPK